MEQYDALNVASAKNQCPAQRDSLAYFKIYHQDKPVQYKSDLSGPLEKGQAFYLSLEESDSEIVTPAGTDSTYLALFKDAGDASNAENRSSDYLKPYVDI